MRKLSVVIACLLVGSPVPAASQEVTFKVGAEIARIECATPAGVSSGTAFHIGNGTYVTAYHVVAGCPVRMYDSGLDYAILDGPVVSRKLKISCRPFTPDTHYLAVGYGFGWDEVMRQPWIASPFTDGHYQSFIGEAIPGMSGGPVVDVNGKVHGLVNMRWPARALNLHSTELC